MTYHPPAQTYLFPPTRRGEAGTCYAAGTQICLSCPLPPSVCEHSGGDESALRRRLVAPICLVDYAIWKLAPYVKPSRARQIGDGLARQTLAHGLGAASFRRAVDIYADRMAFMAELERKRKTNDGN